MSDTRKSIRLETVAEIGLRYGTARLTMPDKLSLTDLSRLVEWLSAAIAWVSNHPTCVEYEQEKQP